MRAAMRFSTLIALAAAVLLAGCGKSSTNTSPGAVAGAGEGPSRRLAPVSVAPGAVSVATRNTTRLGGGTPVTDAAAVARTVYPGLTAATRPALVVLVDAGDWSAALAASVLAAAPTSAPLLYAEGRSLPAVSREALEALHPTGDSALGGAQVLELGTSAPLPSGLRAHSLATGEPAVAAVALARLQATLGAGRQHRVIVVAANAPHAQQMPAAGLAAESGAPILYVTSGRVPPPTQEELVALAHPSIYVVGAGQIGSAVLGELARFGRVSTVSGSSGEEPAENAIAVARYTDGSFGWGVKEPGHGLVFADAARPLDAPAAASLSASGDYGPLLLLQAPDTIPPALASYLSDIQPAYTSAPQFQPVRGVYNHGWLIGGEQAVSAVAQAEIDALLEISPRRQSGEEASQAE